MNKLIRFMDELLSWFIGEVEKLELWKDPAIRNPPSKHQRVIRELLDLVEELKLKYYEEEDSV